MKTLTDIIYQYKDRDFNWGIFDCCIFTASVVEEYTNRELPYWKDVLNYSNYKEARKALKKLNCKDLLELPEIILGKPRLDISEVKLGYPVYYINEDNVGILGICNGSRAYFLQIGGGLTTRDVQDCSYCWSIE